MQECPKILEQGNRKGAAAFGRRPPFVCIGIGMLVILA